MKRTLKFLIASLLTVSLGVATVMCCCIAPSVVALFHKTTMCSHCQGEKSHGNSSNPLASCQSQLTSAELIHTPTLTSPVVAGSLSSISGFIQIHHINFTRSLLLAYPPGGPPLCISFTPLYLRTFNLRI